MSLVKYRLKEVAADFGTTPKEIAEIVAKFGERPKSNTQVLTDEELNCVFDYMTKTHQISSLEQVFAVKAAPKAEPKTEAPKAAAPQQNAKPQAQQGARSQSANGAKPQPASNARPQNQQPAPKPEKPKEPERKRERRVVDTSAVQVNANRFADVDNLVSERVQDYQGGKQRIGGGKGKQQKQQQKGGFKGNRRKGAVCRWRWRGKRRSPSRFPTKSPWASWLPG